MAQDVNDFPVKSETPTLPIDYTALNANKKSDAQNQKSNNKPRR